MRINVKCSSAVHILLMIASIPEDYKITSEFLSSSLGNNPVEVRKLLSSLKKAGLIEVVRGQGGTRLLKNPQDITLLDIYNAVDGNSIDNIIGIHSHPSQQCPFGKNINEVLSQSYRNISESLKEEMKSITLQQFIDNFNNIEPNVQVQFK